MSDLLIKISQASLPGVALIGLTIGFLGSLHCVGMCGAFATSCSQRKNQLLSYHMGKLLSYSLLGLLAGLMGSSLNFIVDNPYYKAIPAIGLGIFFIYAGLKSYFGGTVFKIKLPTALENVVQKGLGKAYRREQGGIRAFLIGSFSALLPCGLLYSTLLAFTALQSPLLGMVGMSSFALGTVPALTLAPTVINRIFKPFKQSWPKVTSLSLVSLGILTITYRMVLSYGQATCH